VGAINVPADKLTKWMDRVPKHVLVYLYSGAGRKSSRLARTLRQKGYSQCKSLVGGLKEWKKRKGAEMTISGKH
jgi:rhodanese-related sulfurtransferase